PSRLPPPASAPDRDLHPDRRLHLGFPFLPTIATPNPAGGRHRRPRSPDLQPRKASARGLPPRVALTAVRVAGRRLASVYGGRGTEHARCVMLLSPA
ncbi:unnamed protein product, partial [Urochloa humidicola]